nr:MAG TPA: hypothetical protein [Caudoviricetes sp.]
MLNTYYLTPLINCFTTKATLLISNISSSPL